MKFKGLLKFNSWVQSAFRSGIMQQIRAKLLKNRFSKVITKHKASNKIQERRGSIKVDFSLYLGENFQRIGVKSI